VNYAPPRRVAGSFRDPAGAVFSLDGRILRSVERVAARDYETLRDGGVLQRLTEQFGLIGFREVETSVLASAERAPAYVLEHPAIPHVSYPYEWCFSQLRRASLLHLALQIAAFDLGAVLSDASAYNVQFLGAEPLFIDILSLRPYRDGEYWSAHRQFCEQFLNPLLLHAYCGVRPNAWYRGALEGIQTEDLHRLVPLRRRLSWWYFLHVALPARLQRTAAADGKRKLRPRPLPPAGYRGMLTQLRRWISALEPPRAPGSVWGSYADDNSYSDAARTAKQRFVAEFVGDTRPETVWDIGCNTGDYAALALASGARRVIGFDADHDALEKAYRRAAEANPSPDQGWRQAERPGFAGRSTPDAIIALALEHHLAIGRNVPLPDVVRWLVGLAPKGVVEFVEKRDPTVQRMLALRSDIFDDYCAETFETALAREARVVRREVLPGSGRVLFWFDRA